MLRTSLQFHEVGDVAAAAHHRSYHLVYIQHAVYDITLSARHRFFYRFSEILLVVDPAAAESVRISSMVLSIV